MIRWKKLSNILFCTQKKTRKKNSAKTEKLWLTLILGIITALNRFSLCYFELSSMTLARLHFFDLFSSFFSWKWRSLATMCVCAWYWYCVCGFIFFTLKNEWTDIHLWAMWLRFEEARTQNQCLYQGHESCCDAMHPNCSNDCKLYMAKRKEKKIIRRKKTKKKYYKNVSTYLNWFVLFFVLQFSCKEKNKCIKSFCFFFLIKKSLKNILRNPNR